MDFRLTRIILIDSYCRSHIVHLDVSGHITINGENGAGKTTLLRLLPMFFGETPSRIIRGNAVTERFGRYYFPTTASYVIFEYQRRTHKALAVIHPDGQTGDDVVYRLIDGEYKPELFSHEGQIVQTRDLYRHLDKQNVFDSRPLPRSAYKQIMQNTAGREHRNLAARFSFAGGTAKLTHLERVVTGILQRATTFQDLKRMIVSSIQNGDETFSLRTDRKALHSWINEYEAHHGIMNKQSVMDALTQADQGRRLIEAELSGLHARLQLLHDHFVALMASGEVAQAEARQERENIEEDFQTRLQRVSDDKVATESVLKETRKALEQLDARQQQYAEDKIECKVEQVDSISAWEAELKPQQTQLYDLEKAVKSLTEIFDTRVSEAKNLASEQQSELDAAKTNILQNVNTRKDALIAHHADTLKKTRLRHEIEFDAANTKLTTLREDKARLETEVKNVQADVDSLSALEIERERQTVANEKFLTLHDKTDSLQKAFNKTRRDFDDLELQCNEGEASIERTEIELEELLVAGSADEDTLLGFLRRHKPNWGNDIGRLVAPETLLRTDLSPNLSTGQNLYGISIDLAKLPAGRYSSEETIQQEISRIRGKLKKRQGELAEDQKALAKKKTELDQAKSAIATHESEIATAKNRKLATDTSVTAAIRRVDQSRINAARSAQEALTACENRLSLATQRFDAMRKEQREESVQMEAKHKDALAQLNTEMTAEVKHVDTRKQAVDKALRENLEQINKDRDTCLRDNGVSTDVLNGIRNKISELDQKISVAKTLRTEVGQYRDWYENTWSQRPDKEVAHEKADNKLSHLKCETDVLLKERQMALEKKDQTIKSITEQITLDEKKRARAKTQLHELEHWPKDGAVLAAGLDQTLNIDAQIAERKRLMSKLENYRENIRVGVEDLRRQMSAKVGTGPEKFYTSALNAIGHPRPGKEHEWIEVFCNWFEHEHKTNRTSLLQLGKTMAQNISYFWKSLNDFKRNVSTFAADLAANLEQGHIFESISDVRTDIRAEVDTQGYWEAVGNLHQEYEIWHTSGDPSLPPSSFINAAKQVAQVIGEDKGLVAEPIDLISLKISANINNQGIKTASNEHELANISSNGLSYIILCVILIGFVNRIRRTEPVVVPFVVDELKDLSFANAKTLLNLLTRNNITMISAFPDVDLDLAELFERNYKILPGRKIGLISLADDDNPKDSMEDIAETRVQSFDDDRNENKEIEAVNV